MTEPGPLLEEGGADDLDALVALERESFSHPWTRRNLKHALERRHLVVLRTAGVPGDPRRGIVGYCVFDVAAGELHVHNLAVDPGRRGEGLGRRLLEIVLWLGTRRGARAALLEVRESNWPALQLYYSVGFQSLRRRRNYYSHPTEDALELILEFPGPAC
ncbi:MAG: ribosomal-protein-alanine N-acetyltransferase [Acidobacteria bacterium]|nr:MAG: ribosomal-protein-alanine N-acetyltransferase [Acidobacteriota bacterium]PYQ21152.1 MAG: ribosomal-protein-alanine N-acetyltransferase [Acidobacteriota bacterium]